jgi:hypothetical protein
MHFREDFSAAERPPSIAEHRTRYGGTLHWELDVGCFSAVRLRLRRAAQM